MAFVTVSNVLRRLENPFGMINHSSLFNLAGPDLLIIMTITGILFFLKRGF